MAPHQPSLDIFPEPGKTAPSAPHEGLSYLKDHRQRLRERFMAGGAPSMPDYELLELILFRAIPRQDVKPLARRLVEAFGSIQHVLAADRERLRSISGVGDAVILELKLVEAVAQRLSQRKMRTRSIISDWQTLLEYCRTHLAHRSVEAFHVLFLDRKNGLIEEECQATGTVDHVQVYPRRIIKRALELDASALILIHNHPSGDPTPSTQDIAMTKQIAIACDTMNIALHDHVIVCGGQELSFRTEGYL